MAAWKEEANEPKTMKLDDTTMALTAYKEKDIAIRRR